MINGAILNFIMLGRYLVEGDNSEVIFGKRGGIQAP
jgi:hypothetical protein